MHLVTFKRPLKECPCTHVLEPDDGVDDDDVAALGFAAFSVLITLGLYFFVCLCK
jgi:hypothetical protein